MNLVSRRPMKYLRTLAIALAAAIGSAVTAAPPNPQITTLGTSGMAPYTVHVHALESSLGGGSPMTARYVWSFGDPGSPYDVLEGWNGAHTYDAPGIYSLTLTITNQNGETNTETISVTVTPDTRSKIHVAASGNDGNNGSTPSQAVRTLVRARELAGDDTSILIRRGDTIYTSVGTDITGENIVIGAYGNGERPRLVWNGSMGTRRIIKSSEGTRDLTVQDLHFDSIYWLTGERNIVGAVTPAGTNYTVRNCTFGHVTDGVNCERGPQGVLVQDNVALVYEGVRAYLTWIHGEDHTYLGNVANGSLHEHNLRVGGGTRINISHNTLRNHPKTAIWFMIGEYCWIGQNTILEGPITIGPDRFNPPNTLRSKFCVIERNHIINEAPGPGCIELMHGSEDTFVRNNIIEAHNQSCLDVAGWSSQMFRTTRRLSVVNNTGYNLGGTGNFMSVESGTDALLVRNNIYVAPFLESGNGRTNNMHVEASDLTGFVVIDDNVWSPPASFYWGGDGFHYLAAEWGDPDGMKSPQEWAAVPRTFDNAYEIIDLDADFVPLSGSAADAHATAADGIHNDFYGNERPNNAAWTAGAVDLTAPPPPGGTGDGIGNTHEGPDDLGGGGFGGPGDIGNGDPDGRFDWDNGAPASLPGDIDQDGWIDAADLLLLLQAWGTDDASADLNGDGIVDTIDLIVLLGNWG